MSRQLKVTEVYSGAGANGTDGVHTYVNRLCEEMTARGHEAEIVVLPRRGSITGALKLAMTRMRQRSVLLNYTHLSWARWGASLRPIWIAVLMRLGAQRLVIVIHDPVPFTGPRIRDRIRRSVQLCTMSVLSRTAHDVVVTVAGADALWSPRHARSLALVPVGPSIQCSAAPHSARSPNRIVVFGVSSPELEGRLLGSILDGLKGFALEVIAVGRGSDQLVAATTTDGARPTSTGEVSAAEIAEQLQGAAIFLVLREEISSRRTTIASALSAGLPIVGSRGPQTGFPVTEAGVILTDGTPSGYICALDLLLGDAAERARLGARSRVAYEKHFAWAKIAAEIEAVLTRATYR